MMFFVTIFLIFLGFFFIYLRGKLLQKTYQGIISAIKEKKKKLEVIGVLSRSDISQVLVESKEKPYKNLINLEKVETFKAFLAKAAICKFDTQTISERLQIEIYSPDQKYVYDAFISTIYPDDVELKLLDKYENYWIRLPGLKRWLDENILKQEGHEQ